MTDTEDTHAAARHRTAYHESGHTVVAILCGAEVPFVSIRPGAAHSGVTAHSVPQEQRIPAIASLLGGEVMFTDPAARVAHERAIVIALAGQAAAELSDLRTGYSADSEPLPEAAAATEALARLAPRHRELLYGMEAESDPQWDEDTSLEFSIRLAGQEGVAYCAWMRQVATRLVWDHVREIEAVARALLAREVLSGDELAGIIGGPALGTP